MKGTSEVLVSIEAGVSVFSPRSGSSDYLLVEMSVNPVKAAVTYIALRLASESYLSQAIRGPLSPMCSR